jgi:hypothetical protein
VDIMAQAIALAKRPHVLVGTPGRVKDHLTNTKVWGMLTALRLPPIIVHLTRPLAPQGFSLRQLQHLVLDEADRILSLDFEEELDQILKVRRTCGRRPLAPGLLTARAQRAGDPARAQHAAVQRHDDLEGAEVAAGLPAQPSQSGNGVQVPDGFHLATTGTLHGVAMANQGPV